MAGAQRGEPLSVESGHDQRARARSGWLVAGGIIAAGLAIRIWLIRNYNDDPPDLRALQSVTAYLTHDFFHAYHARNHVSGGLGAVSWTYPAGMFPLLLLDHILVSSGLSFRSLIAIPNFLADAVMAVLAYRYLYTRRGRRFALAGCALVSLGWPFVFDTGVMNQVDSQVTVFAVAAVMLWARAGRRDRVLACVCLGIATSVKLPFGFLALALLPTSEDWRESARVVGIGAGIPILMTAPFLIADFHHVVTAIDSNHGLPGFAGWGLFVDPAFRHVWLDQEQVRQSGPLRTLTHWQPEIVLAVLLPLGYFLWRRRVGAVHAAAIIALAVWASNVTPSLNFLVWVIPFLILDQQLWEAGAIELAGLIPAIQLFFLTPHPKAEILYVPVIAVMQTVIVVILARSLAKVVQNCPHREALPGGSRRFLGRVST